MLGDALTKPRRAPQWHEKRTLLSTTSFLSVKERRRCQQPHQPRTHVRPGYVTLQVKGSDAGEIHNLRPQHTRTDLTAKETRHSSTTKENRKRKTLHIVAHTVEWQLRTVLQLIAWPQCAHTLRASHANVTCPELDTSATQEPSMQLKSSDVSALGQRQQFGLDHFPFQLSAGAAEVVDRSRSSAMLTRATTMRLEHTALCHRSRVGIFALAGYRDAVQVRNTRLSLQNLHMGFRFRIVLIEENSP